MLVCRERKYVWGMALVKEKVMVDWVGSSESLEGKAGVVAVQKEATVDSAKVG